MIAAELKTQFRRWEQRQQAPPLASDHVAEFYLRLHKRKQKKAQKRIFQWAAIALLGLGLGGALPFSQQQVSTEIVQFQKAEFHLMQMIDDQLNAFETHSNSEYKTILDRSKIQFQRLQADYQLLYQQWETNPSQPQLIQALIANLNTQINLLTEINTTLKTVKEKTDENLQI